MTFEAFQATGEDCADIGAAIKDEILDGAMGRLYLGTLYIERFVSDDGPAWCLTLHSEQTVSEDLETLERALYVWALEEGAL